MQENTEYTEENGEEKVYTIPHRIDLRTPIEMRNTQGGVARSVEKLVFQNPMNAGMLAHIPVGGKSELTMGHFYPIISKMTGEPENIIKQLSMADFMEATEVVGYFLDSSPTTGGN